jgi:hypothetical protein
MSHTNNEINTNQFAKFVFECVCHSVHPKCQLYISHKMRNGTIIKGFMTKVK